MEKLYKLTDQDGYTRRDQFNETLWEPGYIYTAVGSPDQPLCSSGWLHVYEDLLTGVFLNPAHANIINPRALECLGVIGQRDGKIKAGCRELEAVCWVDCPVVTEEQRVRFAIGCAWAVCRGEDWRRWAMAWLTGEDRTRMVAARAAARAADAARAVDAARAQGGCKLELATIARWAVTDSEPAGVLDFGSQ